MKRFLLAAIFFMVTLTAAFAQTGMSFQGLIRQSDGSLASAKEVSLSFSVVRDDVTGELLFRERHLVTTNEKGMFSLVVGSGEILSGDLLDIDWQSGKFILRADVETVDGEDWSLTSDMTLMAVPYTFFAGTADSIATWNLSEAPSEGTFMYYWSGDNWVPLEKGTTGSRLSIDTTGIPVWVARRLPEPGAAVVLESQTNSALIGYDIISDGGLPLKRHGIVLGTSEKPVIERDWIFTNDSTLYELLLEGLPGETSFYVRAFAENELGLAYGEALAFELTGCFNETRITLVNEGESLLTESNQAVVSVEELSELEYVEYFVNGEPFASDRIVVTLPNPGDDFTVYARGIDANGCISVSNELTFDVISTTGEAVCIPDFTTALDYDNLEAFSFAEEKVIGNFQDFRIKYNLSSGFDIINLYSGDIYGDGLFLGATYMAYPQDTIYFSEEETAYYLVFSFLEPTSEARVTGMRAYLKTNALFDALHTLVEEDLATLGYVDEYSDDKFDLVQQIIADLDVAFNDESGTAGAPNPLLTATGTNIVFSPEGNTMFYAGLIEDANGTAVGPAAVFSGEPLDDLPYMFRFISRLFGDESFLDALMFRSGADSKFDLSDITTPNLPEQEISVVLDNGRVVAGDKFRDMTQLVEIYNTGLHFYNLFSLFPTFRAVDGLILSLSDGTPDEAACLDNFISVLASEKSNFIRVFLDDAADPAEALSLFSYVCFSLADVLSTLPCTGQKSMYKLLTNLGNRANDQLATYNALPFNDDVANATRSASHRFHFTGENFYGKQVTGINHEETFMGIPGGVLSPAPTVSFEEYTYYAEEMDADSTRLRVGELIPSGLFAGGGRTVEIVVSFEPYVSSVTLGTEVATVSPHTFVVSSWENEFQWKIANSVAGFQPGERIKLGEIAAGTEVQEIYGIIDFPDIRYLANESTTEEKVVEVHMSGISLTGKYPILFEIVSGDGDLRLDEQISPGVQAVEMETGTDGKVAIVWKQFSPTGQLRASVLDENGNIFNSIIIAGGSDMVFVEGGSFTMGCTTEQGSDCEADESPAHTVNLPGFFIGRFEVTHAQWASVMGTYAATYEGCPECPVTLVGGDAIQEFLDSLNVISGLNYRLPTEAEWEFAARGGLLSESYKYAGSNTVDEVAWYELNTEGGTMPVGQKLPNELGLYDMSGNIAEWCQDWYSATYYSSSPANDPQGPSTGSNRVVRGGSWNGGATKARVSDRDFFEPTSVSGNIGFRVARSISLPEVITDPVMEVMANTAIAGGEVVSDGDAAVTARGVVWSIFANPTLADQKTTDGSGIGAFSSSLTGLVPGTTYYIRAYATNAAGTAYGERLSFTTPAVVPTVETTLISGLTDSSAVSGGNVSSDGGSPVTERGIVWSTGTLPDLTDMSSSDGSGLGIFTSSISGLEPVTTYYVRAYATNAIGTAYGEEISFTTPAALPTVLTLGISGLTDSSAVSGGNITSDGGSAVLSRGIVWSTVSGPDLTDSNTTDGSGTGLFASMMADLLPGTVYYVRAYATNALGTSYGAEIEFITAAILPTVSTAIVTAITDSSAISGGQVLTTGGAAVTARGVVWSTMSNPELGDSQSVDGSGTGIFASNLTGLEPGVTYYIRAYATNGVGTAYGQELSFTTPAVLPTVAISGISSLTDSSAVIGAEVLNQGGAAVTVRGIVWSTNPQPDLNANVIPSGSGTGVFQEAITGLDPGTIYYVRAYATNSVGTAYSEEITVTTPAVLPVVVTNVVTAITDSSAVSGGNVLYDGGATITSRGIVWSDTPNPTLAVRNTSDGTGSGSYTSQIKDLVPGTVYYVRAYATNSVGTAYGQEESFMSAPVLPQVETDTISSITYNSAVSGGNVTYDGGASVSSRGLVWGTAPAPILDTLFSLNGSGTGSFTGTMAPLDPGMTYYVRAYATNAAGTAYGQERTFMTPAILPQVVTDTIISLTDSSALSGGTVLFDGGANVILRGLVWSEGSNPTLDSMRTINGSGEGIFTGTMNVLEPVTTYHYRAYATNTVGTAYGEEKMFSTPAGLPTVTTDTISMLTDNSAVSGGNVSYDGGDPVTAKGIVWSEGPQPTLDSMFTLNGSGEGNFTSSLAGLSPGTVYHIRAYATNGMGTGYGNEITFRTPAILPTIVTDTPSAITDSTAVSGGNISYDGGAAIIARGVVWARSVDPVLDSMKTTAGTGTGQFSSILRNLEPVTTYYVRAYATNEAGTAYGQNETFMTPPALPTVTTDTVSMLTDSSAVSGGEVVFDGGDSVTVRGLLYGRYTGLTIDSLKTMDGSDEGIFTSNLSDLDPGITYYIRAYATNGVGTGYGAEINFTTPAILPTVVSDTISMVTDSSAVGGGVVLLDGGATVTARGVVWGTSSNPEVGGNATTNGSGTGAFASTMTNLSPVTTYYARAYATNRVGTAYGAEYSFTTPVALPTVTTAAITGITDNQATGGGNVLDDGGAPITARGVVWERNPNPLVTGMRTTDGSGTGSFVSTLNGLSPVTVYYVRAYATNSAGTAYGEQLIFESEPGLPLVTTDTLSNITDNSANGGGVVILDGGSNVTARGVVYGTHSQPEIGEDMFTVDGSGTGPFSSSMTGLLPGTLYYMRTYATNAVGTAYGEELSFYTPAILPTVTTLSPYTVTDSSALSGGEVLTDGGDSITARGVVWGISTNPVLDSLYTIDSLGLGTFGSLIDSLSPVTTYYVRAYATNGVGTAYGEEYSFTTPAALPSVVTSAYSSLTDSSVVSGGTVSFDGGAAVTARGLAWGLSPVPTIDSMSASSGSGEGSFVIDISGLDPETKYYTRAWATNAMGTAYAEPISFVTPAGLPRVSTLSVSSVTDSSAVSGGNVTDDRGADITARGIVWSTSPNPTLTSGLTSNGTGTGLYSSSLSGLSPGTKYYIRAYATNAVGTTYGNQVSFTTPISMTLVQGGTFTMGCTPEQVGDCDGDESAAHSVTLSSYYIGKYEVTQAEWLAVMGSNPGYFTGCSDCPIENVSYTDVQNFIAQLNIQTGYDYRLPTEAEWEYAARGGQESEGYKYAGGDGPDSIGWYIDNTSAFARTASIGQKTPNELDLYDMSGNVWEWVSDWYGGSYDATAVTNPTGQPSGTNRVIRGGSWFSLAEDLRVSERNNQDPTTGSNRIGFRLARSVSAPVVETFSVTGITDSSAMGGGNVLTDGGSLVTARGLVWSTTSMPTILDNYSEDGSGLGAFESVIDSLDPGTTYYVRAYATNGVGTNYGGQITFTTPAVRPTVTTSSITDVTDVGAILGGNVTDNGGATVTARGVVWSTTSLPPTIADNKTTMGTGTGMFADTLTSLSPVTTYYIRAYATNSAGTAYGAVDSFTTLAGLPQVLTTTISSVMDSSAITGGTVTSNSGDSVTVRGVVWSTSANPTVADSKTTNGSDIGTFADTLSGLLPVTTYYVRAYATNGIGTGYGQERSFTTSASLPLVATVAVTMKTDSSAVSGGTVLDDGGASVTARGIVWSTTQNPTLSNNSTNDGSGTGSFVSSLTDLNPVTTYYVRAYATNSAGTAYGQQVSFATPAALPTVTSLEITGITDSTLTGGGDVLTDGGSAIIERGLVWGLNPNPTIDSMQTNASTVGTGSYTTTITGLNPVTTYYIRAFATNTIGTSYGVQRSITTLAALPDVTTTAISSVTDNSALTGGNVTFDGGDSVLVKGIVWSTSPNPTTADNKTQDGSDIGTFSSSISGLDPSTVYYVRAYATNSVGTSYGDERSFTTGARLATVTTIAAAAVTDTSATSGGNVTFDGGDSITARGIVWSTISGPTLADNVTIDSSGTGVFESALINLDPVTTYYIRAYATNSVGTAYGNEVSFQTLPGLASITTTTISGITDSSAASGGIISYDGGAAVTARGVVWSTAQNPTVADAKSADGAGSGSYASALIDLDPGTTYYARAYATNSVGTAYGQQLSFATDSILATLTTLTLSSLTDTSVVTGGNISLDGGSDVLARGVVWSTTPNPTILNNKTVDGSGSGTFSSQVTGLTYETSYYLRAYATNGVGTAYGNEINFTTPAGLPVVTTDVVSEITETTAVSGGNITNDKGSPISARGVVWSTAPNPTLSNNYTTDGTGTGIFESEIPGLLAGTKYYVRAYATNDAGTAYGSQVSFTTPVSMVLVEGGTYDMGCTTEQGAACNADENPAHSVNISAFYLGTYEVSQSEWQAVMGNNPSAEATCATCPVESVSWNDVATFIDSLNTLTGLNYRLPTEAEWEFAARGGNESQGYIYAGGNTPATVAWYNANASTTQPKGTKLSNELGLYDMSGNASEWVSDWYDATYYTGSPSSNPAGPGTGTLKVVRGGSWYDAADSLRVANRLTANPASGYATIGFRLARSISLPTLTTTAVTAVTDSSGIGGGTISFDGGAPVTARGIVWATTSNPTLANNKTTEGTGEGTFTSALLGLSPGITYYVRAYATNGAGTAYGTETTFTTPAIKPTIQTRTITTLTDSSAVAGGNVLANGGAAVTARGVVWATTTSPTLDSMFTTDGIGTGLYASTLDSLNPVTTYYMRAYATNSVGTAYGEEISFTTPPGLPVVQTDSIRNATDSSAVVYAEVLFERGDSVTARGIVWSTSPNPTLSDQFTLDGSDTGAFADTLSNLQAGTTYYVRAYATNSAGTGYGNELTFTSRISMVFVGGGSFTIGATAEQGGDGEADETPTGTVQLGNYYLGKYEVTQAEWLAVMGSNPSSVANCPTCPIENVSWTEVQEFIDSLNAQTGFSYRLPTEAEWEYAARGGNVSEGYKYAGSNDVNAVAWNFHNSDGKTWPVGQKQANELGIYDMSGNVYEWVGDWYDATYYTNFPLLNPTGMGMGTERVARGGSWFVDSLDQRVSNRESFDPDFSNNRIGFRLALPIDLPTVLTDPISSLTDSSAVGGGEVIAEGGSSVTDRGLVWGSSPNPTLADNVEMLGMGAGTFSTTLDTLDPGTTYYVRSYAINNTGTAYGKEITFTTPAILPTVTTDTISMVTDSSAVGGGNVVADGGAAITARGLVWGRGTNLTLDSLSSSDGTGTGAFSSVIDSLIPVTKYYVKAYATNSVGTAFGELDSLTTPAGAPEVLTDSITNITDTTVVAHANAYFDGGDPVTEHGIVWGTSPNPDTTANREVVGAGTGTYMATLDSLSPGITYYVRGYAINSIGIGYGNQLTVTTDTIAPTVTTDSLTVLTGDSATGGGNVVLDGGAAVTARGIVWGRATMPTLDSMFTVDGTGTGTFTSVLDTLLPLTTYYMRAYATNDVGTSYGNEIGFRTPAALPIVSTDSVSTVMLTDSTNRVYGTVSYDGDTTVTARGMVWATSTNPTLMDSYTTNGTGTGSFTSDLSDLIPLTTYYVRGYATNSAGTGYGNELTFTTPAGLPRLTTTSLSNLTDTTAVSGGTIISDGGTAITAKGIVWGTSPNPTTTGSSTNAGTGTASFSSTLTGLEQGERYYVRAYATNSVGTAYGNELSFTTSELFSMVLVPGGTFTMGCTGDPDCQGDEMPIHSVTIDSFLIGRYEVTQAQFEAIMNNNNPSLTSPGCADCPVENQSWALFQVFISDLNDFTGLNYRLPTEAEWEYAARGGNMSQGYKYSGSNNLDSVAWYNGNAGGSTHPVGEKLPNELGIYDMSGNVFEFVSDWYSSTYYDVSPASNPTGPTTGTERVLRGGYWGVNNVFSRAVSRHFIEPTLNSPSFGIRLARDISLATVVTDSVEVATITASSAVVHGELISDGNLRVSSTGFVWSTSPNPTLSDNSIAVGDSVGTFSTTITGLTTGTTYYVRAYATNLDGTSYGTEIMFDTN